MISHDALLEGKVPVIKKSYFKLWTILAENLWDGLKTTTLFFVVFYVSEILIGIGTRIHLPDPDSYPKCGQDQGWKQSANLTVYHYDICSFLNSKVSLTFFLGA